MCRLLLLSSFGSGRHRWVRTSSSFGRRAEFEFEWERDELTTPLLLLLPLACRPLAFIEKVLAADTEGRYKIVTVGEEKHLAYNRVGLTEFFEHRNVSSLYLQVSSPCALSGMTEPRANLSCLYLNHLFSNLNGTKPTRRAALSSMSASR